MADIKVSYINLDNIKPYKDNPRFNDGAVDAVAKSINDFGFKQPIVVDKDNVIIAGHTRYKAAKKLNLKTVPIIIADDLDDAQVKAYRLADNKVGEFAEWDFNLLGSELGDLENLDVDMAEFGFDDLIYDDFDDDFTLDNKDAPLFKTMTITLSNAQFDVVDDALKSIVLDKYDINDNTNVNGNKFYKLVTQWQNQQKI